MTKDTPTGLTEAEVRDLVKGATPGPWACHFGDDGSTCDCKYILAEYGGMGSIATVDVCATMDGPWGDDSGPAPDTAKANARLIVAAPDLARALLDAWVERDAARTDAEAAVALVVERAAERLDLAEHDAEERDWRSGANAFAALAKSVRALAPVDGLAAVQELRAERDESRSYALALEQELRDRAEATEAIERDVDREYKRAEKAERDLSTSNYQVERLQALTVRLDAERDTLAAELTASRARERGLREALEPFAFYGDEPNTTQEAWEIRYRDRFQDWIDFGDIEAARAALAQPSTATPTEYERKVAQMKEDFPNGI